MKYCHKIGIYFFYFRHMLEIHSFHLPDLEYVSDLTGLMEYLGAKVRIDYFSISLFNNKDKWLRGKIKRQYFFLNHIFMNLWTVMFLYVQKLVFVCNIVHYAVTEMTIIILLDIICNFGIPFIMTSSRIY